MHRRLLFAIALLLLAAVGRAGAQTAVATGVISEQGRPIVGATVVVDDTGETVVTDQDGRYTYTGYAGSYTLRVALHGYAPVERQVTLEDDETTSLDLELEPVLSITALEAPDSLGQGEQAQVTVTVRSTAATDYTIEAAGLGFAAGDVDRGADFAVEPDSENPTSIPAGGTETLRFTVTASGRAETGAVTVRASLFAFDTALGENLLPNGSFERGEANWAFGVDGSTKGTGVLVAGGVTGSRSAQVTLTEAGDARAYWSNPRPIEASKTYVLSGYIKTEGIESEFGSGAAVYVPVTGNDPYQQPNSPWIAGTRGWRKAIISFTTTEVGAAPTAHSRAVIQQSVGTAWFDNLSLTDGEEDGSLTVTGGDRPLTVAAAAVAAPALKQPAADEALSSNPPTFTWDPVAGATAYDVEVSGVSSFDPAVAAGQVTGTSFTPAQPLPLGVLHWRVRAVSGAAASAWSEGRYVQSYAPGLAITGIGSTALPPGESGVVTLRVRNTDPFDYDVSAVGIRFTTGQGDVSASYQVVPDASNPTQVPAGATVELKLDVTAADDAPTSGVTLQGNLFAYNTAIGTGANLIANPSLEAGEYDEFGYPEGWGFGQDAPSEAVTAWVQDVFLSGNRSFRFEKVAPEHQSYLQHAAAAENLKPNTTYTFSGWFRTEDVPEGGGAGLLLWWNDGSGYKPSSPVPRVTGTQDWTYLRVGFTTADVQPTEALARANVFAEPGGFAWVDNLALSEGSIDGAVTVVGGTGAPGQPLPADSLKGDVNGDAAVSILDVISLLRHVAGLTPLTGAGLAAADVDRSGGTDVRDVLLLLRHVAGLVAELP